MREQREIIYSQRLQIINEENSLEKVTKGMIRRTIHRVVESHTLTDQKDWNLEGIVDFAHNSICAPDELSISDLEGKTAAEIEELLSKKRWKSTKKNKSN